MKKRALASLLAAVLALVLAGCSSGTAASQVTQAASDASGTWTVAIYICGSDLESDEDSAAATNNIQQMLAADLPSTVHVVLETGGTTEWQTRGIDASKTQRWVIEDGELKELASMDLQNMGDPDNLASFLAFAAQQYPADHTVAVLWDHGAGPVDGALSDDNFDGDTLTVPELAEAFGGATASGALYDIIGFDACLMGSVEVATALEPSAQYLVASENLESGCGWDYTAFLNAVADASQGTGDAVTVGGVICDSYLQQTIDADDSLGAMLAVIDLSKISAVTDALDTAVQEVLAQPDRSLAMRAAAAGMVDATRFGASTEVEGFSDIVDVTGFGATDPAGTDGAGDEGSDALAAAVQEAVVYLVHGDGIDGVSGLSIFYPLAGTGELDAYERVSPLTSYADYLKTMADTFGKEGLGFSDPGTLDGTSFSVTVSEETRTNLLDARTLLLMATDDGRYVSVGTGVDLTLEFSSGEITAKVPSAVLTLGGVPLSYTVVDEGEGYVLYSAPVRVDGALRSLRFAWLQDGDSGAFQILGLWDGLETETGTSQRGVIPLDDGDRLEVVQLYATEDWSEEEDPLVSPGESDWGADDLWRSAGTLTYRDGLAVQRSDLPAGTYQFRLVALDVLQERTYSDPVDFSARGGPRSHDRVSYI